MRIDPLRKYLIVEIADQSEGYYLGRYVRCRENPNTGAMHIMHLEDGHHSEPEGVADAYELHKQLGFIKEGQYVMVKIEPLPQLKPEINQEAVNSCLELRHLNISSIGETN